MPLVTLAEAKAFRGIDTSEHDGELLRLLDAAEFFVEGLVGRPLAREIAQVDFFDGGTVLDPPVRELRLRRPPVHSLTTIEDDPLRGFGAAFEVLASQFVLRDAAAGIVTFDGYTPNRGINNLKVTYDGGYDAIEANNPAGDKVGPLKQAILELAWAARNKGFEALIGQRSKAIADVNLVFLNNDWPMNLLPILERYKLDWVR